MLRGTCFLLLAIVAGCGDDDGGGPAAAPVPVEEFCVQWAQATCAGQAPCMCAMEDLTACEMRIGPMCPVAEGRANRRAIEEGRVIYDAEAAGALIQLLRDASCDLSELQMRFTIYEQLSGFNMLNGTLEPGTTCDTAENSCRRGYCRSGTCFGLSVEGEPCDVDPMMAPETFRACFGDVPGDENALRCAPDAPGSQRGTCLLVLADGQTCTADLDCVSQRCAGTCMPRIPDGTACTTDSACESGLCDFSTGRCRSRFPDGELCTEGNECQSGYCDRDLKLGAGNCRPLGAVGDACEEDEGCASTYCAGSGTCAANICDGI